MRRRLFPSTLLALAALLGACVGDRSTDPERPNPFGSTTHATWSLTHGTVVGAPSDSCASPVAWVEDETRLLSVTFVEGTWSGLTFSGAWFFHQQLWEDYEISGTLEVTIDPADSLVTSFTVDQTIVWNLSEDFHRHETATIVYNGPGLALSEDDYGYVFRLFGEECCDGLVATWKTWLAEEPDCTYTAEGISCEDLSTIHVGFYPRP